MRTQSRPRHLYQGMLTQDRAQVGLFCRYRFLPMLNISCSTSRWRRASSRRGSTAAAMALSRSNAPDKCETSHSMTITVLSDVLQFEDEVSEFGVHLIAVAERAKLLQEINV